MTAYHLGSSLVYTEPAECVYTELVECVYTEPAECVLLRLRLRATDGRSRMSKDKYAIQTHN